MCYVTFPEVTVATSCPAQHFSPRWNNLYCYGMLCLIGTDHKPCSRVSNTDSLLPFVLPERHLPGPFFFNLTWKRERHPKWFLGCATVTPSGWMPLMCPKPTHGQKKKAQYCFTAAIKSRFILLLVRDIRALHWAQGLFLISKNQSFGSFTTYYLRHTSLCFLFGRFKRIRHCEKVAS